MAKLYPMDVHISIFVLHYIDSLIPLICLSQTVSSVTDMVCGLCNAHRKVPQSTL